MKEDLFNQFSTYDDYLLARYSSEVKTEIKIGDN